MLQKITRSHQCHLDGVGVASGMTRSLLLRADGTHAELSCAQALVAQTLGGPVTFVGGIPERQAVLVGRADAATAPPNACLEGARELLFEPPARGDVVACATDGAGEEADLDVTAVLRRLGLARGPAEPA